MELLLIRHALPVRVEAAGGPADPALSDAGRRQAERLARWLAVEHLDAVYTSPLRRARETAGPLAAASSCSPLVEDGLAEYDRNSDTYIPIEELRDTDDPRWRDLVEGRHFEDAEMTGDQFRAGVVAAVDRIISSHPSQRVAAVCHGGVINAYLSHCLGMSEIMFFEPTYTSVSRLMASSRGHRTLLTVNEAAHLREA